MLFCVRILSVLPLVAAATSLSSRSSQQQSQYDYIVVGGGTSGLVVANRLSEDPNVSVLVIEAGDSVLDNPNVTDINAAGLAIGTDIDWQYETTNQVYAGNRPQVLHSGKALGGSSTINGMAYARAEDVQIDAWQAIGNNGWNWTTLFPYYLKSEHYQSPNSMQMAAGASYNPKYHGFDGLLKVGYPRDRPPSDLPSILNRTCESLGIPWSVDVNGGKMRGFNYLPLTVDSAQNIREDAARAYYWPFTSLRPNINVLTNTRADKIVWENENVTTASKDGSIVADGVQITMSNGTVSVIRANKEVILSAGSVRSPALLELSGVGNPRILNQYNITVKVALPTVGENLQDQMTNEAIVSTNSSLIGYNSVAYASAQDLFGDMTPSVAAWVQNSLADYAAAVANASQGSMNATVLQRLFQVQHNLIFKNQVPVAEIVFIPTSSTTFISPYWGLLPFARGNVHITSADPAQQPAVNPNYFMLGWDNQQQIATARFTRRLFQTEPLRGLVVNEIQPGLETVPERASDIVWENWIKASYRSNFHPVGTAAMMPRSLGGVVSDRLVVYGTSNVRVVDASVLPFQLCGHLTSTLYAVAERASDMVKEDAAAL